MANSSLQGKTYQIPFQILSSIKSLDGQGIERVTAILNNSNLTYEQVKRLKHDIENGVFPGDWSKLLMWANSILERDRNMVDNQKRTPMEIGMENRFRKTHDKDYNANITPLSVNEETKVKKIVITEAQHELLKKQIIEEEIDFSEYKVYALRKKLKEKTEQLISLKNEIRQINSLLNKKSSENDDDLIESKNKK